MIWNKQALRNRILVVGYGNADRADDGAAYYIANTLRGRLGAPALAEGQTGLEDLGSEVDVIFLSQLVPEILELMGFPFHNVKEPV